MADETNDIQQQSVLSGSPAENTSDSPQGIQFEDILPWGAPGGDTGLSSRLKLKRNFERIKAWMDSLSLNVTAEDKLSREEEDYAEEQIGFLKGLWIKAKGLFGFSEEGDLTANNINANGNGNVNGDLGVGNDLNVNGNGNVGGDLTVGGNGTVVGDFGVGGLLTALRAFIDTVQSDNYSGSGLGDTGWQLTNDDGTRASKLTVDKLEVRMKALFKELEIRKESYSGGNRYYSPAGSVIDRVEYYSNAAADESQLLGVTEVKVPWLVKKIPFLLKGLAWASLRKIQRELTDDEKSRLKLFRCYMVADDGTDQTRNWWRVDDQARCQTFNLAKGKKATANSDQPDVTWNADGVPSNMDGNRFWWRRVARTGTKEIDGKLYDYVDFLQGTSGVSGDYYPGSDWPAAGDSMVCWGNRNLQSQRHAVIAFETIGDDAPAIKIYKGIHTFSLQGCRSHIISPDLVEMKAREFRWIIDNGATVPPEVNRGAYSAQEPYYYYDRVSWKGSEWLCIYDGESPTTGVEPGTDDNRWRCVVSKGVELVDEVVSYAYSTSGTSTPTESQWKSTRAAALQKAGKSVPDGLYEWVRTVRTWSDGREPTTSLTVTRVGAVVKQQQVEYYVTDEVKSFPTGDNNLTWADDFADVAASVKGDSYIWTRVTVTYTDGSTVRSYTVGRQGNGVAGVEELWAVGTSMTDAPGTVTNNQNGTVSYSTSIWKETRPAYDAGSNKIYLWNFELTTYTDGTQKATPAVCIGNLARGIVSIEEAYALSTNGTTRPTSDWGTNPANYVPTDSQPFQWNRTTVTYSTKDSSGSFTQVFYHVSAVKGTTGSRAVQLFKWAAKDSTAAQVGTPTGDNPSGWSETATNRTSNEQELWMSVGTKDANGNLVGTWSTPVRISGLQGTPGEDGRDREWIFKQFADEQPSLMAPTANNKQQDDYVPTSEGWTDRAQGVSDEKKFEYACWRDKARGATTWGDWEGPILWSHFGRQGLDGDGIQYIFKLYATELTDAQRDSFKPKKPNDKNAAGEWMPVTRATADTNTAKSWTDDAESPTKEFPFCYVSLIKCVSEQWGDYGRLALWSKWSEDGSSPWVADLDNEMDSVACDVDGHPTSQQEVVSNFVLYFGSTPKKFKITQVSRNGTTMTRNSATNGVMVSYLTSASTGLALSVTYYTQATIGNHDDFAVQLKADDDETIVRTLHLTVNGVRPGPDGQPATIYNLVPSPSQVVVARTSDGGYNPATALLTCGYTKNVGGVMTSVQDATERIDSKYYVYFRRRNRSDGSWNTLYYRYNYSRFYAYLESLDVATYSAVEFIICNAGVTSFQASAIGDYSVIDRETVPVLADGKNGTNGLRGDLHSTVYRRTNSDISNTRPTGGSYDAPWPGGKRGEDDSTAQWWDGFPPGTEKLWQSERWFYGDTSKTSQWSKPTEVMDTVDTDVEFSPCETNPGTPTTSNRSNGRYSGGQTYNQASTYKWFDPVLDASTIDWTQMVWRAEQRKENGVGVGQWVITRIKGEKGDAAVVDENELSQLVDTKINNLSAAQLAGLTITMTPSAIILDEDIDHPGTVNVGGATSSSYGDGRTQSMISVKKGDSSKAFTVTVADNGHTSFKVDNTSSATSHRVWIYGFENLGTYNTGCVQIDITVDDVTYRIGLTWYVNRLGTWSQSIKDGIETILSTKNYATKSEIPDKTKVQEFAAEMMDGWAGEGKTYRQWMANVDNYDGRISDVVANVGTYRRDYEQSLSQLSQTVQSNKQELDQSVSNVQQTAQGISQTVAAMKSRNLLLCGIWEKNDYSKVAMDEQLMGFAGVSGLVYSPPIRVNSGEKYVLSWYGNSQYSYALAYIYQQTAFKAHGYDIAKSNTALTLTHDVDSNDKVTINGVTYSRYWRVMTAAANGWITVAVNSATTTFAMIQIEPGETPTAYQALEVQSSSLIEQTAQSFRTSVSAIDGRVSTVEQTANGLQTRVSNAEGNVSQIQQTTNGLQTRVSNAEGNVTQIQQTTTNISLQVDNLSDDLSGTKDKLLATGIYLSEKKIEMNADKFALLNNSGEQTMGVDENGDVAIAGTVKAKNLYHGIELVTDRGMYRGRWRYSNESYYQSNVDTGVGCTGPADIIVLVNTNSNIWQYDSGNGYGTVRIPRPQDYQGKYIEIHHKTSGQGSNPARVMTVDGQSRFVTSFAYSTSNSRFVHGGYALSELMLNYGGTMKLLSVQSGSTWYWLRIE